MKKGVVSVGVAICVVAFGGSAFAQGQKVDLALREALQAGGPTQNVIISVKPGFLPSLRQALEAHGDLVKTNHAAIEALSAEVHSGDVLELARQAWVESVSIDADVFAIDGVDDAQANDSEAAASSDTQAASPAAAPQAPDTHLRESLGLTAVAGPGSPSGKGIVVAIIDSGIRLSPDLDASRVIGFYDFTRPGCLTEPEHCAAAPFDDLGHGTHVAGLIGSSGALSGNLYQGIAPQTKFVVVKVLGAQGSGKTSDVIAALEFVTKYRLELGVRVINLSLGHAVNMTAVLDPLVRAVERASAAGITVVVAAGNNAKGNTHGGITSPANAPSALTTGAVDTKRTPVRLDDLATAFSARGPTWFDAYAKPDFMAPGSHLISDTDTTSTLYNDPRLLSGHIFVNGHAFLQLSGTSMGAAVASGVVALVLEANQHAAAPPLTPNAVKAILQYTGTRLTVNNFGVLTQGSGLINAAGAVSLAAQANTAAPLGEWWLQGGVVEWTPFGVLHETSCALPDCHVEPWSKNIIWGTDVLGGDLVYRNLLIWSSNVVWGSGIVGGIDTNILWGTGHGRLWSTARAVLLRGMSTRWAAGGNILWGTRIVEGIPFLIFVSGDQAAVNTILWGAASGPVVLQGNIVWSTGSVWANHLASSRLLGIRHQGDAIVGGISAQSLNFIWGTSDDGNVFWGTSDGDNIVWGTSDGDNILWGTWEGDNILWGTAQGDGDNILWGTSAVNGDNILWGTWDGDNILWGTSDGDNILWGTSDGDNILWGTAFRR